MAALPEQQLTVAAVYDWWRRSAPGGFRDHLGCSLIGHECLRHLWLSFRWALADDFDGRTLRLLDRGQREEAVIFKELRGAGIEVSECDDSGNQWRVSAGRGHVGGSLDAAARGFPEAPHTWHVVECKTHNDKSFKDLERNGVQKAKPMHYAQMQAYMFLTGMDRAFYIAVNKNDDRMYTERVHLDKPFAAGLIERAEKVVDMPEPPPRLTDNADFFVCKMCRFRPLCHEQAAPVATCRSCAHSTPVDDGAWTCERHGKTIDSAAQRRGCDDHRVIPILLERFAEHVGGDAEAVVYRHKDTGRQFVNGPRPGLSSAEIAACGDKSMLVDEKVAEFRNDFEGTIVG